MGAEGTAWGGIMPDARVVCSVSGQVVLLFWAVSVRRDAPVAPI